MSLEYTIQCLTSPTLVSVLCDQWYPICYVFAGPRTLDISKPGMPPQPAWGVRLVY